MGTMYDHAARIHAATVAIHEAVEDQLSSSSEVSAIVALDTIDAAADALAAELAEANARIARLIPLARHHRAIYGNAMSPEEAEWARAVIAHGDLDGAPGDTN